VILAGLSEDGLQGDNLYFFVRDGHPGGSDSAFAVVVTLAIIDASRSDSFHRYGIISCPDSGRIFCDSRAVEDLSLLMTLARAPVW
jgi:hypothetical protein